MVTGLTYLLVSVTVLILLALARRERHEHTAGLDVFRYPTVLLRFLFCGIPIYGLIGAFLYARIQPPAGGPALIFVSFFAAILIAVGGMYAHFSRFFIEVGDDSFAIGRLFGTRRFSWSDVGEIAIVHGSRGGAEMTVRARTGTAILVVGSSIQDFDSLVWLMRNNSRKMGCIVRERDRTGNWSQSTS